MALITQAFVLGAGLGTRLRPLTEDLPKPLVPVFQKPLITFAFDHLIDLGIEKFLVNTHHRPERFAEMFPRSTYRDRRIDFRNEPELLETAGGIANIRDSLGHEHFLVYNGDILTDLPIAPLITEHFRAGNIVTLALRSQAGPRHIAFDRERRRIVDVRNQLKTDAPQEFVFSGVYAVSPKFLDWIEPGVKRSVIPIFLDLIRREQKIGGAVLDKGHWWDVGTRDAYLQLHRELREIQFPEYPTDGPDWRMSIHKTAHVDPTAQLLGCTVVGADCVIEADVVLEDTILWPGAQIASRSRLRNCIVRSGKKISGEFNGRDL
ncbi:MAG: mannose-phosphate guanylyltransferase [Verrucomicrobiota bacterium]|jgi:mannose-1-phosphate guanylyltransferase/mannose-1-phosphate guanylyltransferase/phosphomannomutase